MAEWQTAKLKRTGGADGEDLDARMARERQERWEASAEFQAEVAKQEATNVNIDLASASQVTHDDIAQEKMSEQEDKATLLRGWIAEVTGQSLLPVQSDDLSAELKSGVVLCSLLNAISPGMVPNIQKSSKPFPQRENIKAFTEGARALGVPEHENFETNDLFEASNMKQVLICLLSLGRRSENVRGYNGPTLKSNTGKGTRAAKSSGKVRQLSTNLKDLIPMGASPVTHAEVGSEEWIKQQLKAEKQEKEAAAAKAAEAAKPLAYHEMRPFELKKLLKQAGMLDTGTKAELIARLEERDRVTGKTKLEAQKQPADEPKVQKISAHASATRAKRRTGRKPPSRIRAKIPEGTPVNAKQQQKQQLEKTRVTAGSAASVLDAMGGMGGDAAVHLHVGGLDRPEMEDEQKLYEKFSRFGTVLAVTLRRRRVTQPDGSQKVSWALVAYAEPDAATKALEGVADLQLGRDVVCKPMDIVQAMASKGEMGRVVRQHQSRTGIRKGGTRELYRCVRKAIVREEASKDSASLGDLFPGDILEELYEVDVDGTRRLNFETIWAERGPDLGLSGWMSIVNSAGDRILEALSADEASLWRLGTKPTLLRRSIAMYKSLAEQSLVHKDGSGGGVYSCAKPGVIRADKDRESEKVGMLAVDSVVPVSAAETLESGIERVRFESTPVSRFTVYRSVVQTYARSVAERAFAFAATQQKLTAAFRCWDIGACSGVWKATGPNLGLAGWSSIASANGAIVLEPMSQAKAEKWRIDALALLGATLGRQGLDVEAEARTMSVEEQGTLLNADGATLSRVAEDTYARARQRWRKGLGKLSVLRALGGGAAATGSTAPTNVIDTLRQEARDQQPAGHPSTLIRSDLIGPATLGAMASAVAECAVAPGQTRSTAEMLRKLAASLAQLDEANKAAEGAFLGDEV